MSVNSSTRLNDVDLGAVTSLVGAIQERPGDGQHHVVGGGPLDRWVPVRGPGS